MRTLLAAALLAGSILMAGAQDKVSIPKSRLEELERKEAELKRLLESNKNPFVQPSAPAATQQPAQQGSPASAVRSTIPAPQGSIVPPPAVIYQAPAIESLTPLAPGEVVDAATIASHFQLQPQAAATRYKGKQITFTGTISSFDRPLIGRNYKIIFRPAGVNLPIICDFYPPETLRAVFSTDEGATLVGTLQNEARVTLAKMGQQVTIQGECRGASKGAVRFSPCKMLNSTTDQLPADKSNKPFPVSN